MLVIRYRRIGKRNHAQYKIAVAEKSCSVSGKFVEAVGSYDPHKKEAVLKEDRIKYWLSVGAQCSDSVHNLLVSKGLIKQEKRKVNIKPKAKEEGVEEVKPAEAETTEAKPEEIAVEGKAVAEEAKPEVEEVKSEIAVEEAKPEVEEKVSEEKKEDVKEEAKPEDSEKTEEK